MHDLRASIEHLNETTNSLAQSSKKLDGVVERADATMASAKKDADDLQGTIGEARKTFSAATQLMRDATNGNGLLASVIKDSDMASDLRALVANLRTHSVFYYRVSVT